MAAFDGARLKLQRAEGQAADLADEIDRFFHIDNQAHGITTYRDANLREWRSIFRRFKSLPDTWPVQVGEVVHNLRSALDYLVYDASAPTEDGRALDGTEFPIFIDQPRYLSAKRGGGLYKTRGLNDATKAFVAECQPFAYSDPPRHYLWLLQELSNADKHRLFNFATTYYLAGQIGWGFPGGGISREEIEDLTISSKLDDGEEVFYLRTHTALPEDAALSVNANIRITLVFDDATPGADFPVIETIHKIGTLVGQIVAIVGKLNPQSTQP